MNQKIWYIVVNGKAEGPFTQQEIQDRVNSGTSKSTDFVFRPGLANWVAYESCPEFKVGAVANPAEEPTAIQKTNEAPAPVIAGGPAKEVEESKQQEPTVEKILAPMTPPPQMSTAQASSTFDFGTEKDNHASVTAPTPQASRGSDEQTKTVDFNMVSESQIEKVNGEAPKPQFQVIEGQGMGSQEASTQTQKSSGHPRRLKLVVAGIAGVLGVAVALSFTQALKQSQNPEAPVAEAPQLQQNPQQIVQAPQKVQPPVQQAQPQVAEQAGPPKLAVADQARIPAQAPGGAQQLKGVALKGMKLVPLKLATNQPQLVVEGSFQPGDELKLEIRARSGQILKFPSFYGQKELRVKAGQVPTFNLADLKLPAGVYTAVVKTAGQQTESKLNIGQQNGDYQAKLKAFRKVVAAQQKKERLQLQRTLASLKKNFGALNESFKKTKKDKKKWGQIYKGWNKSMSQLKTGYSKVSEKDRNKFAYPEQLLKVKQSVVQLTELGKALDSQMKSGRSIASDAQTSSYLKSLKNLEKEVQALK